VGLLGASDSSERCAVPGEMTLGQVVRLETQAKYEGSNRWFLGGMECLLSAL
jgi:hypothetical protein